ncbi:hypothetical protein SAICODRAFT_223958 [Saitoella complicata NRRL Y-17804]|nr:uncharacterized protein SAICODRAFT_223958 [Saitoella complicata NRRL Y-17804]ODQ53722.1 hypothetical protein SAICODRAFT_223958 [Saitoella complicata NRRL Y-17804]
MEVESQDRELRHAYSTSQLYLSRSSHTHAHTWSARNRRCMGVEADPPEQALTANRKKDEEEEDKTKDFECNICFETAASPVLTLCGHLYCWPCLYHWLGIHASCPVCKNPCSTTNVVPIYGRGGSSSLVAADPGVAPRLQMTEQERHWADTLLMPPDPPARRQSMNTTTKPEVVPPRPQAPITRSRPTIKSRSAQPDITWSPISGTGINFFGLVGVQEVNAMPAVRVIARREEEHKFGRWFCGFLVLMIGWAMFG